MVTEASHNTAVYQAAELPGVLVTGGVGARLSSTQYGEMFLPLGVGHTASLFRASAELPPGTHVMPAG